MTIRMVVQFSVAPENLAQFKKLTADMTTTVREKEGGRTLCYDFFAAGPGSSNFVLFEVYTDAEAFTTHFVNLGERAALAQQLFQIERMVVSGELPSALAQQLKTMVPGTYCYDQLVASGSAAPR